MAALRGLHQVFEARQVGEAGHGGEHALVGMGAVGEELGEQQAFLRQLVEIRRDVARRAQGADIVAGEAFQQDHHHVADRQGVRRRRGELAAHRGLVGVHQLVVGGQQHLPGGLQGDLVVQGGLPDVRAVFGEALLGRLDQGQGAVQAQLVGEHGFGGEGIAPAQRRALAQGAAGGEDADQHAEEQHHAAHVPGRGSARPGDHAVFARLALARAGRQVDGLEHPVQHPGGEGPGQQVADHRETVPEHAHDGLRVFRHVLEDQAVQALVELAVEVQFEYAEEQGDAGEQRQPCTEQAASGHRAYREQRQHQRRHGIDDDPQVETHAVAERLEEGARRGRADQFAVVDQQGQAQQAEHDQQHQRAERGERQVAADGGLEQPWGRLGGSDFRLVHVYNSLFCRSISRMRSRPCSASR